jgi:hypothetical protein
VFGQVGLLYVNLEDDFKDIIRAVQVGEGQGVRQGISCSTGWIE